MLMWQFLLWSLVLGAQQLRGQAYLPPRHATANERALWLWLCTPVQPPNDQTQPFAQGVWDTRLGRWCSRWARHVVLRSVLSTPDHAWQARLKLAVGVLVMTAPARRRAAASGTRPDRRTASQ